MVRLKLAVEMSVLKNLTIRSNSNPETDCWVAILKTAVAFNSLNAFYDGLFYKSEIHVVNCRTIELNLLLGAGQKQVSIKFGSRDEMNEFCAAIK